MNRDLQETIRGLALKAQAGDKRAVEALRTFVQTTRNMRVVGARTDPSTFLGYVMRDEETGIPISLAPYHHRLQTFLSANNYAGVLGHVECGKTMNVTVGRVLHEVGKNRNLRVAIVMATQEKAKPSIRLLSHYIAKSREYREVFPQARPSKAGPWNTTQLTIERDAPIQQPTIQALGLGSDITGKRLDLVILDDILTGLNTLTPRARKSVLDWIQGTLISRLTRQGRIWFIANAWHPEDAFHVLTKPATHGGFGWSRIVLPVKGPLLINGEAEDLAPEPGGSNWPDRWTPDYIKLKTRLFGGESHPEVARQLYCQARSDDAARFKRAWIDKALEAGKGIYGESLSLQSCDPQPGWRNFTGMDLGVKKEVGADLTAQAHVGARPDGKIQLYGVESGRFDGPEILRRTFDANKRYKSTIIVENNAAQDYIRQFAKNPDVAAALGRNIDADRLPIHPYTTTAQKKHDRQYGIESIGAEMATGRWIIPCVEHITNGYARLEVHPEIEALITDLLYYDPMGHPGDRLMALWMAHQGARRRTFSWRVADASEATEEDRKHWTRYEAEAAEKRRQMGAEERARQQHESVVQSAWGDF